LFCIVNWCVPVSAAAVERDYCSNVDAVTQLMQGKASVNINDATALLIPLVVSTVETLPLRCANFTWTESKNGGHSVYGTDVLWVLVVIAVQTSSLKVTEVHVLAK